MTTTAPSIERTFRNTIRRDGSTRRECWGAVVDGCWQVAREEESTTPWSVKYLPTGETVPFLMGRQINGVTVWCNAGAQTFGTLDKCVKAIRSGWCTQQIERGREAPEW